MKCFSYLNLVIILLLILGCTGTQQAISTQTPILTLTTTYEPTATITPTPKPSYELCPNIEAFRDCYVLEEELLDGSYWNWLNEVVAPTLVPWFQAHEDKIKDVSLDSVDVPSGKVITFDISSSPNFEDPETAPFKRDVTSGYTTTPRDRERIFEVSDLDFDTLMYRVYTVFFYEKSTQEVYPLIFVDPTFTEDEDLIDKINKQYLEGMNVTLIHFDDTLFGTPYSIVSDSFEQIGRKEMEKRMIRFLREGDFSALSDEGIVLLTGVSTARIYQ